MGRGLAALLLALAIAGPGLAGEPDQPSEATHKGEIGPNAGEHLSIEGPDATTLIVLKNPAKIGAPAGTPKEQPKHEDREPDVGRIAADAARDSANAARSMNRIATAGVAIAFLTLLAAAYAAWHAKRAANEAGKAATHAAQGNIIAREMGQAQVRAYPVVKKLSITVDARDQPTISVTVENNGNSPALDLDLVIEILLSTGTAHEQFTVPFYCGSLAAGCQEVGPLKYPEKKIKRAEFASCTACHVQVAAFCKDVFGIEKSYFRMFARRNVTDATCILDERYIVPTPPGMAEVLIEKLRHRRAA